RRSATAARTSRTSSHTPGNSPSGTRLSSTAPARARASPARASSAAATRRRGGVSSRVAADRGEDQTGPNREARPAGDKIDKGESRGGGEGAEKPAGRGRNHPAGHVEA